MIPAKIVWRLRIPELMDLANFGLDDMDADKSGNVFITDSVNKAVYKFSSISLPVGSYPVVSSGGMGADADFLKLAVHSDSSFYVADMAGESIVRYLQDGADDGAYWTPGILSLCLGPNGTLYVLSEVDGICRIDAYSQQGEIVNVLPAPKNPLSDKDPSLVSISADLDGNVYVTYGMPPYKIWKVLSDGSGIETICRDIDYSEDAVLISDIDVEPDTGVLWVLLACKKSGLQLLDSFDPSGEFMGTTGVPHSERLYGVLSVASDSELYLLDSGTGPGSGELLRCSILF